MSKFLNYVKKFLALSFISASVAFLISCSSSVLGIVQIVPISDITNSISDKEKEAISAKIKNFNNKVYKANADKNNSVLYAVTTEKTSSASGNCTAVVMENDPIIYASIGSAAVGGTPDYKVDKIMYGVTLSEPRLTIDSWDEVTNITPESSVSELKLVNLGNGPKMASDGSTQLINNEPTKMVYDAKTGTLLGTNTPKSPIISNVSNNDDIYASSKELWDDLIKHNFAPIAINTGKATFNMNGNAVDPQEAINFSEPTVVTLSYTPNADNKYYKSESLNLTLYPLSEFYNHISELSKKNYSGQNDTETAYKTLQKCVNEYSKLTENAKETSEVVYTNDVTGVTTNETPKYIVGLYSAGYVLSASVSDLCEKKNRENPSAPCTEDEIMTSIEKGTLSADDRQYLLTAIEINYDKLDDGFGDEIKQVSASFINDLKKTIKGSSSNGSSEGSGSSDGQDSSKGGSSGSGGSSSGSSSGNGSSSGTSGSSSGKSGSSASIKTGSESLLMLFSSLGLSSGALLTLRKREDED